MKKQTKLGLILAAAAVISVSVASLVSAKGWVQQGGDWYYVDNNNEYVTDKIVASGNSKFYLGEEGTMMKDFLLEGYGDSENYYYFGPNGAMVVNTWVAVDSTIVENKNDEYEPDVYWFYFQASGKAMKGTDSKAKKATIDGKKYAFDQYGHMCTGWFGENGEIKDPDGENPFSEAWYYAGGDNDGVLRAGWLTYYDGYDGDEVMSDYGVLYFYFNTSNNKKYGYDGAVYKKINGKNYAFTDEGVMLSGWDPYDMETQEATWTSLAGKVVYFSGEDDGHQVKKGWVYAVPSQYLDQAKYDDDEEEYMYFGPSGDIERDKFKKINGKWYAFNENGIMKKGLVIWCPAGTDGGSADGHYFVDTVDMDYAEGADIMKKGKLQTGANDFIFVEPNGRVITSTNSPNELETGDVVKLHYFAEDGSRKTGLNTVAMADENYTFHTVGSQGDKGSGSFGKKYYSLGFQLKANSDIRYGIYTLATPFEQPNEGPFAPQSTGAGDTSDFHANLQANHYIVLTTSGSKQKGSYSGKKDADGNYWLIQKNGGYLKGIFTQDVHVGKSFTEAFKTRTVPMLSAPTSISTYSDICEYSDLVANNVAYANPGTFAGASDIADSEWYYYVNTKTNTVTFQLKDKATYPAFKSDINENTNKWIPMGIKDNANKSIMADPTANEGDFNAHGYDVVPNNDYFLNCYWID